MEILTQVTLDNLKNFANYTLLTHHSYNNNTFVERHSAGVSEALAEQVS